MPPSTVPCKCLDITGIQKLIPFVCACVQREYMCVCVCVCIRVDVCDLDMCGTCVYLFVCMYMCVNT